MGYLSATVGLLVYITGTQITI